MTDDLMIFSNNQPITVTAVSNYAGCGGGSAGAGVLDTAGIIPSSGTGGYGYNGAVGGSPIKFTLTVSVGVMFQGPANAMLSVGLQDSADNASWATTNISDFLAEPLSVLQNPGQIILQMPLPGIGGSTNALLAILRQYLRMLYTVTNGPFTAGTINARLDVM